MYTNDIMRVKHYYKNGDDVNNLLEGYWESPGPLDCTLRMAVLYKGLFVCSCIHQFLVESFKQYSQCNF